MPTPKSAVLLFAAVVFIASLAALATLVGLGTLSIAVGVPLMASLISAVTGAALALINPAETLTRPGPATPPAPVLDPAPAPAPANGSVLFQGPVPDPLTTAAAPAMPQGA